MSQLGFDSLIPTVKSGNIDGVAILECCDTEDFADLFPLATPTKRDTCYHAFVTYRKKNRKKKKK